MTRDTVDQLREALAEAFDDLAVAREVAERAGIRRNEQPIDQPDLRGWWRETIRVAWRKRTLVALVEVAGTDPRASQFAAAFTALHDAAAELQTRPAPAAGSLLAIPTPPAPPVLFGRDALLDALAAELLAPGPPIALVGPPVARKTEVALGLADRDDVKAAFPDGRAWLDVGPNPILLNLLGRLLEQFGVPFEDIGSEPARADRLRQVLDGKACLVILSGIWKEEHAKPILDAIRPPARAVFTTRSDEVARELSAAKHEVPPLDRESAVQMLENAGKDARAAVNADRQAAKELAETLGCWPTVLTLAGHRLDGLAAALGAKAALPRLQQEISSNRNNVLAMEVSASVLSAFDERGASVGAILRASYDDLRGDAERRAFRRLAVFGAKPADFDDAALVAVWETDANATLNLIIELMGSGLLERIEQAGVGAPRYAVSEMFAHLADVLLTADTAERDTARARHIAYYLEAMRKARDADRCYTMRPDLPQVLNALRIADASGNWQSLMDLLDASADLLRQFGAGKARLDAANRAMELAGGDTLKRARAVAARALAYTDLAGVDGEDRGARLREALAGFDEALLVQDATSLEYARTLMQRARACKELATVDGEDRQAQLHRALSDAAQAVKTFETYRHAVYLEEGRETVRAVHEAIVAALDPQTFDEWWGKITGGQPVPDWLG